MKETLRLHSIVAFNSRMAVIDTTLPTGGGHDGTMPIFVPAGTEVNFSTHVMHRWRDLWGEDAGDIRSSCQSDGSQRGLAGVTYRSTEDLACV